MKNIVEWLAQFIDDLPKWLKALIAVWLILGGVRALLYAATLILKAVLFVLQNS